MREGWHHVHRRTASGERSQMSSTEYASILVERQGPVGIVTLNRPQALNALNAALIGELGRAFDDLGGDTAIAALVLPRSGKASAGGPHIKERAAQEDHTASADGVTRHA